MEATATYPQWPPVLVSTGLGGAIVATSPDCIPLQPVMVNDARRRVGGVDCVGVLRECHRNFAGYGFARSLKRTQFKGEHNAGRSAHTEAKYFDRHNREFVPRDIAVAFLQEEIVREREREIPKWQGNAVLGTTVPTTTSDHALFFPSGQILQQARVLRTFARDRKRQRLSNAVECGAVIRQFELLGSRASYEMYGESAVTVAARGATNCTILKAAFGGEDESDVDTLSAVERLRFDNMLYHIAGSPHTESEIAFVTGDGKVHTWDSVGGIHSVRMHTASVDERLLRCEYTSNPCVLWTSNRVRIQTLDLREPQTSSSVSLFDLVKMNAPHSEIYAVKRRERAPFQVIVGTSVSLELLDTRMPGKALLSWQQRHNIDAKLPYYGAIDEVHWGTDPSADKGAILSSTQGRKTVSLYPFARQSNTPSNLESSPFLCITPLRSTAHQSNRTISQYMATDAPLDLQLRDGSEWTSLVGVCALADDPNASSALVYQLSSMGDLFCQHIRPRAADDSYEATVQVKLPCGVTTRDDPNDDDGTALPVPADAIEDEHASDALTPFVALPVKGFVDGFPRLPDALANADDSAFQLQTSQNAIDALRRACRPSATLFRLHRFVHDELHMRVTSPTLLRVLRSHAEFRVRSVYHRFREPRATVLDPFPAPFPSLETRASVDDRLAICTCVPQTALEPCDSLACVVPHALIITSASDIHTALCFPTADAHADALSDEWVDILEQAREAYGQKE